MVAAVSDVTPQLLSQRGLKAVMVDMDDTLMAANRDDLNPDFVSWAAGLREAGVPTLLLSNGTRRRVLRCSKQLGVEGLPLSGKPWPGAFKRGLDKLGSKATETAMVGDQLFTDVLGANLIGMTSILVNPLSSGGLPHTRLARTLESWLLARQKGGERGRSLHR